MINGDLIFPTRIRSPALNGHGNWTLAHSAREHVARAFSAGRHQAGAIVDRIGAHIGSLPRQSHGVVRAAHDANQTVPVSNADIRVSFQP